VGTSEQRQAATRIALRGHVSFAGRHSKRRRPVPSVLSPRLARQHFVQRMADRAMCGVKQQACDIAYASEQSSEDGDAGGDSAGAGHAASSSGQRTSHHT
jgi:hypothetical protein